jgi:hypothetical protein
VNELLDAAIYYAARGWHVFPCKPGQKIPATPHGVKDATTDPDKIRSWWARWPSANIALACGEASGVYVADIDMDAAKGVDGFASLAELGPIPRTVKQSTPRGGAHFFFKAAVPPKNKNGFKTGIDIRGEGYYVVLAPSANGTGGYVWENSPDDAELAEWPECLRPAPEKPRFAWDAPRKAATAPSGASDVRARASAYLARCEPAVQGHSGHAALLKAARALVEGFAMSQAEALSLLWSEFNPRCCPPWDQGNPSDRRDFERKVTEALKTPKNRQGHLVETTSHPDLTPEQLEIGRRAAAALLASAGDKPLPVAEDNRNLFAIPEHLYNVPGFVGKVMDYCLQISPYPNKALAFAGALSLQALLCARKVRTEGDMRPNLYILALAPSGSGKDSPRKLNKAILLKAGMAESVGDRFASAEGIEDEIFRNPACLYQTDEFDALIQAMAKTGEPLFENMMGMILSLYGSAATFHVGRKKAGDQSKGAVANPHLNIFGTAVPVYFYNALNERMMTNGLLSRMLIIDADTHRSGQRAGIIDPPDSIVGIAKWWKENTGKGGDLASVNPVPATVRATPEAQAIFDGLREKCDAEYNNAPQDDELRRTVYSRVCEMALKLSLIYACSVSAGDPSIDLPAATWAAELATAQANRLLALAEKWGGQTEQSKTCDKVLAKIKSKPGIAHHKLLRSLKMLVKEFDPIIATLIAREEVDIVHIPATGGPPSKTYVARGQP